MILRVRVFLEIGKFMKIFMPSNSTNNKIKVFLNFFITLNMFLSRESILLFGGGGGINFESRKTQPLTCNFLSKRQNRCNSSSFHFLLNFLKRVFNEMPDIDVIFYLTFKLFFIYPNEIFQDFINCL